MGKDSINLVINIKFRSRCFYSFLLILSEKMLARTRMIQGSFFLLHQIKREFYDKIIILN